MRLLAAVLAVSAGLFAQACAAPLRCRLVGETEVCERRECRDLMTGEFAPCPAPLPQPSLAP